MLLLLLSLIVSPPSAFGILKATPPSEILARYPGQDDYIRPWTSVSALAGQSARLPCDLASPLRNDSAMLVLWYRSGTLKPIYSYDVRRKGSPSHWKNRDVLGSRATFHPKGSSLSLDPVNRKDTGTYTCRIDFEINPTLSYFVNLTVIVPPKHLTIVTSTGAEVDSIVGPLKQGSTLRLTCVVEGGSPSPSVTWWDGTEKMGGGSYSHGRAKPHLISTSVKVEPRRVSNTLTIKKISRADLHRSLTCRATNTDLAAPLSEMVSVDMILPPLWVKILSIQKPLSAGTPIEVVCQTAGARPPIDLRWTLDGVTINSAESEFTSGSNITTSLLKWTPSVGDGGKTLACEPSEKTPAPGGDDLRDRWALQVNYIPRTSLRPGRSLDLSAIEEGDDVYFECKVQSSPPVYKIMWLHEGRALNQDISTGIILINQSLVVQKVNRSSSGDYTCTASNIEGDGVSNTVNLRVKYAPMCQNDQPTYHGAARNEQVNIPCYLDSHPPPHSFVWTFNNSGDSVRIPEDHVTISGSSSTVSYTPTTELDYGTLLCWGSNSVGKQKHPCIFHVFPAGRPDPVTNCSQFNLSATRVSVHCNAGFDGGLPQTFIMELYDGVNGGLVANRSNDVPKLSSDGLEAGSSFIGVIYSVNAKGKGELLSISVVTIQDQAEKRTAAIKPAPSPGSQSLSLFKGSFLAITTGVATGLFLMIILITIFVRLHVIARRNRKERRDAAANGSARGGINKTLHSDSPSTVPSVRVGTRSLHQTNVLCSDVTPDVPSQFRDERIHAENVRVFSQLGKMDWLPKSRVRTISSSSSLAQSMATLPRGQSVCYGPIYPNPMQSCAGDLLYTDLKVGWNNHSVGTDHRHHSSHICLSTTSKRSSQPFSTVTYDSFHNELVNEGVPTLNSAYRIPKQPLAPPPEFTSTLPSKQGSRRCRQPDGSEMKKNVLRSVPLDSMDICLEKTYSTQSPM